MISFKNLKGMDGIDKLNECVPLVDEIFSDTEIFSDKTEATFGELATPIYKKHTEAVNKLFMILEGEQPESAAAILSGITRLMIEVSGDKEIASFFMGTVKSLRQWLSATLNTKEEQSKDT